MDQFDVAVVGSGPAGSTAALTMALKGVRVLQVERTKRQYAQVGESLPPAIRPLLENLGLFERFRNDGHVPCYGNRSAWGSPELDETNFIFNPYGHGWHLDRHAFDAMLAATAGEAGILVVSATQVAWDSSDGLLRVRRGRDEHAVRVGGVLDCSGRAAAIGQQQGARRIYRDNLVALAAVHEPGTDGDVDSTTIVESVSDGWWYTGLLPGARRIFVYLTDVDLLDMTAARDPISWLERLECTRHLWGIHDGFGYRVAAGPTVVPARSSRLHPEGGEKWLAAGDAAITFDPLSSQGIITAMSTAQQAAAAMIKALGGDRGASDSFLANLDRVDRDYLAQRARYYALEQRWIDQPFWKRRIV